MLTYRNKKELEGKTLELGDTVIFTVKGEDIEYKVRNNFLAHCASEHSLVFDKLGIKDIFAFASNAYWYYAGGGSFPKCRTWDYSALTRIALALFDECEKVDGPTIDDECENEPIPSLAEARKAFQELTKHYTVGQLSYNGPSRSWDEYLERHPTAEGSEDLDKKLEALRKLVILRDEWRGESKQLPLIEYWGLGSETSGDIIVYPMKISRAAISFPTDKMAEDFLKTFRPLIEEAGDLI